MADLVERHKPHDSDKSRTRQVRTLSVPVTTPVLLESEDSPQRAEQVDHTLVDQRGE
jgi:hypothetical protein